VEYAREKKSTSQVNDVTPPKVLLKVSGYTSEVLLFRSVIERENHDI
jgi:hypothetical protein